jgi:hypothetical protein
MSHGDQLVRSDPHRRTGWIRFAQALALLLVVGLIALLPLRIAHAQNPSVQIENLQPHKAEDGLLISASQIFDLPPHVEQALRKGIGIVFVTQVDLIKERWYWTDKQVTRVKRSLRLSYQPLTSKWRVQVVAGSTEVGLVQNFDSLAAALGVIRRLHRLKIADWQDLDVGTQYTLEVQFRLDTSQLPRPFQIGALQSSDWSLGATQKLPFVHDGKLEVPGK